MLRSTILWEYKRNNMNNNDLVLLTLLPSLFSLESSYRHTPESITWACPSAYMMMKLGLRPDQPLVRVSSLFALFDLFSLTRTAQMHCIIATIFPSTDYDSYARLITLPRISR
jgi:integral membrane sensor domain MASE1